MLSLETTIKETGMRELSLYERRRTGLKGGVMVEGPVSRKLKEYSNITEGFIITCIDGHPVSTLDDLVDAVREKDKLTVEGIYPDGTYTYYCVYVSDY